MVRTRSRKSYGGTGNQAEPNRNRRDDRPNVGTSSGSGGAPRSDTTRTQAVIDLEQLGNNNLQGDRSNEHRHNNNASTDKSVADELITQPTQSDRKQRTRWTLDEKEYLLRCYYILTEVETTKVECLGRKLHQMFTAKYPGSKAKTEGNLIDYRKQLMKNNRFPAEDIKRIKEEVAQELGWPTETQKDEDQAQSQRASFLTEARENNLTETEMCLLEIIIKYQGVAPERKPMLPKLHFKPGAALIIQEVNNLLAEKISQDSDLLALHNLIYAGAYTVLSRNGQKVEENQRKERIKRIAPWEKRLKDKITKLREEIGILSQLQLGHLSKRKQNKATHIIYKHRSITNPTVKEILDLLKQKLMALSKRLKRYQLSNQRKSHNTLFNKSEGVFYRRLLDGKLNDTLDNEATIPPVEQIKQFWNGIWANNEKHKTTKWYTDEKKRVTKITTMLSWEITDEELRETIRKTHNWKAPGPDKLHNFWIKNFTATHKVLAKELTNIIEDPERMPTFLTQGITYLIPKTTPSSDDPAKYRPITCLPTIYKILTAIIASKIYHHLQNNKLLDEEQKGCRQGSRGCKELLIIDSIITGDAKRSRRSLYTAYIDYQKAYDSVPHSWLLEVIKLYGVHNNIYMTLQKAMSNWHTTLLIKANNKTYNIGKIPIQRGIFQGDALSPLWFCMALRPLTTFLNQQRKGYVLGKSVEVSHLLYMDDIKLFASNKKDLDQLLKCTEQFSRDVKMTFGLEKCKTNVMIKGEWSAHTGYEVNENQGIIEGMGQDDTYKYLGYQQARGIEHKTTKENVTHKYIQRVKTILKTQLSARNKTKAINTLATSVLTYSFGVIKWTQTELENLNRLTRTTFTKYRAHHPKSALERFHLPRSEGGRGIPDVVARESNQIQNLREYFLEKAKNNTMYKALTEKDINSTPLKLATTTHILDKEVIPNSIIKEQWKSKALHGRYPTTLDEKHIDKQYTQAWLNTGDLHIETEGFLAAIQDQVIATKYYRKTIIKDQNVNNINCRICQHKIETIDHIVSGCTVLAPKAYLERHNKVAGIIHQQLCHNYQLKQEKIPYYLYEPQNIEESPNVRIYWNRIIATDKYIPNNIPDIVVTMKNEKVTYIIDIAIPLAHNIEKTQAEKISKYLPLADEIKQMWHMDKVVILPAVIGATGEIPVKLKKTLNTLNIDEKYSYLMQKAVILDTCNIVRRVLNDTTQL